MQNENADGRTRGGKSANGNLSVEIGGAGTTFALALRAIPTPEPAHEEEYVVQHEED